MKKLPIIGITADMAEKLHFLNIAYADAVAKMGGVPVILPANELVLNDALNLLDGLLLSGGDDIHASHFGQNLHEKAVGVNPWRDAAELSLGRAALERDLPILGICRGMQMLNVICGGSLNQHIEGHKQNEPRDVPTHDVEISGRLANLMGGGQIKTNTIHHQVVDRVGDGLEICGRAKDGQIEALWGIGRRFVCAVQWHPEELVAHEGHARIFSGFIKACLR